MQGTAVVKGYEPPLKCQYQSERRTFSFETVAVVSPGFAGTIECLEKNPIIEAEVFFVRTLIRSVYILAALLCAPPFAHAGDSGSASKIRFERFSSPILFKGTEKLAYRDPAVVYHEGRFYLYFTLCELDRDGGYHSFVAMSTSTDLQNWLPARRLTPRDRNLNYCAPGNVIRYKGEWILCYQSYPTPNKERYGTADSRIFIARSKDLTTWSAPELLRVKGDDVKRVDMGRMIDPYLIEDAAEPGKWWCFYKQNGVSMSWSHDLKTWHYEGHQRAGENVTILRHSEAYLMFHAPGNGIGIKRSKSLKTWGGDVAHLVLGQEHWPWAKARVTAATVVDLTGEKRVGNYLMFFHGSRVKGAQPAHGEASLALAWSDDLFHWSWPGKEEGTLRVQTDAVNKASFTERGIMMFADTSRGRPFAKDPAVVRFGGRYLLYYSVCPGNGIKGWRIGVAESDDLVVWKKRGELLPAGPYEKNGFCAPGALVLNGRVHLFYQTYGNGKNDALCHAFSDDGLHFIRNKTNPVFSPEGDWNCGRAIDADVYEHNGKLFLYFATRDPSFKTQMQGVAAAPIDSGFGRDAWRQLSLDGPILTPELSWERRCIEAAALCRHAGKLYMFYAGSYNNQPQQIGCAVSSDGVKWMRLFKEPFLPSGGEGEWNSSESGHPYAFEDDDGRTYLFYQGNDDRGKTWYLSHVEIGWKGGRPFIKSAKRKQ